MQNRDAITSSATELLDAAGVFTTFFPMERA
jgi:hypothetical protein